MKREEMKLSKIAILKWFALFAVVFALAVPANAKICKASGNVYRVSVSKGYLALRTAKAYDSRNEIGELYSGDTVEVSDYSDSTYWYVYSPKYDKYGYVNKDYLVEEPTQNSSWTVSVEKGYLALRDAKAYDSRNEIGELYSGDTVELMDNSDSTYWYVYSPKYDKYGYVNKDYLVSSRQQTRSSYWTVSVAKGYLALRTAKAYDSRNEIGELYSGDVVEISDSSDPTYWYVYSPKYDKYGYVNKDYLIAPNNNANWTVSVSSGYLALRTAKAYDSRNEIGELYSGDVVEVRDSSDSTYWYVYSPKHDKYGYVNKDYLVGGSTRNASMTMTMTVRVSKGYLALRTAKSYDESNEIGELYTGDVVEVHDTSDADYWYVYSPKYDKYGYVNSGYLY